MIQEYSMRVLPQVAADTSAIKNWLSKEKGIDPHEITHVRVLKRSIDARQRTIYVNLTVCVYTNELPPADEYERTAYQDVSDGKPVIVVGAGPGGLFAALRLIELGCKPIVLERGKNVHDRKRDIAAIKKNQRVDAESNYCFGEGGAGAYSDGKLYTRSKKRGSVSKILNVFCQHGASTDILVDAHPHIGTDKLPRVIENMRNTILQCGGEVHFQTKMVSFILDRNSVKGVRAVNLNSQEELTFNGPVILATGHSARDVYRYLFSSSIEIEAKALAVGVRLEHPSHLIDQIQYHDKQGRGKYLPAAEYSFVTQVDGRGVYSFCMCPGGFVIPAATENEQIVVNGMSPANRGSQWSNSGMVVEIHPEDVAEERNDLTGPLCMMNYQKDLEHLCWLMGNKKQTAPAQRMEDFVQGKASNSLPSSSYTPGLTISALHEWLPGLIAKRLQQGFRKFGIMRRGFLTNEAVMIGVETRTSSPIRILRDPERLHHVSLTGFFPCGEGAGYAGGIVSAAVDGERCAEMCAHYLDSVPSYFFV